MGMADDEGDDSSPIIGFDAFRSDSESARRSRAAQYLAMSAYAFGGPDLAAAVQEDGDHLDIPHVAAEPYDELAARYGRSQSGLDRRTMMELRHHTRGGFLGRTTPFDAEALWSQISQHHQPSTLLALLNAVQQSSTASQLEIAAAASSLAAFSRGELALSTGILERLTASNDVLVREIALRSLDPDFLAPVPLPPQPSPEAVIRTIRPVSATIHGTWALVVDNGWHQPGSPMHSVLRQHATRNLYADTDYYRWSGAYSDYARATAAAELGQWCDRVAPDTPLDTVYAHSHGGNVALNAAAQGTPIRLLVLLHTPANRRPDEEWAAIRQNVRGVIAMHTRLDLVLLADSLRTRQNRLRFDPQKLPHFPVVRHWKARDAWFSHSRFITVDTWERFKLADLVKARHACT
jgi:hypothetical protein